MTDEHKTTDTSTPAPAPSAVPQPASSAAPAAGATTPASSAAPAAKPESESDAAGSTVPRRGRVTIEMARCTLGEIINVSPTGVRVGFKGARSAIPKENALFSMEMQTPDGLVTVPARIVWVKRTGFRKFDIGIEFGETDPATVAKLRQLATMAGRSIVINDTTGGSQLRAG